MITIGYLVFPVDGYCGLVENVQIWQLEASGEYVGAQSAIVHLRLGVSSRRSKRLQSKPDREAEFSLSLDLNESM